MPMGLSGWSAVASVFGRIGAVASALGDYAASQISNDSSVAGSTVAGALNYLLSAVPVPLEVGVILPDADETITTDVQRTLLTGELTEPRTLTVIPSSTVGRRFPLLIGTQPHDYYILTGGSPSELTYIPAGERVIAWVTSDGVAGKITTTKLGAEPI